MMSDKRCTQQTAGGQDVNDGVMHNIADLLVTKHDMNQESEGKICH